MKPIVWVLGGSDSCGVAGVQADLLTLSHLEVHAATILTAVTAQNLTETALVFPLDYRQIEAQLSILEKEALPNIVKIGMLGSALNIENISDFFSGKNIPLVLDPVVKSSAGTVFINQDGIDSLTQNLLPLATIVTPNIPEAEILSGKKINSYEDIIEAASIIRRRGAYSVVIKGGHWNGEYSKDYFLDSEGGFWLDSKRITSEVRGTGCVFASALAAFLAKGESMREALVKAKVYVWRGIHQSEGLIDGKPKALFHNSWSPSFGGFPFVSTHLVGEKKSYSFPKLEESCLGFYPIVPRSSWIPKLAQIGVKMIQLRIKDLSGQHLEQELMKGIHAAKSCQVNLFINDYWEFAAKFGAYGVHLGQEDLQAADLDMISDARLRLGVSTHNFFEVARARGLKPSYIAVGPIYETTCKNMAYPTQGLDSIPVWKTIIEEPLIVIGGLRLHHVSKARSLGVGGVAAISDWLSHVRPLEQALKWKKAWDYGSEYL